MNKLYPSAFTRLAQMTRQASPSEPDELDKLIENPRQMQGPEDDVKSKPVQHHMRIFIAQDRSGKILGIYGSWHRALSDNPGAVANEFIIDQNGNSVGQ
jgi:hypothetical protein